MMRHFFITYGRYFDISFENQGDKFVLLGINALNSWKIKRGSVIVTTKSMFDTKQSLKRWNDTYP